MARYLEHRLKLRQLRIVSTIAAHGSISGASRAMDLSQPTLTKALHDLETALGFQLFVRLQHGVEPTAAGKAVVETADRMLAELSLLDETLSAQANSGRRAMIGCSPASAASLIPHVLAQLRISTPDLEVEITEGESDLLLSALTSGSIDMVVGDMLPRGGHDGLGRRVLCEDEVVLVAKADHPLFAADISFESAAAYGLIVPPARRGFGASLRQALLGLPDFRPKLVPSTSIGFAREMLKATDALALASRLMMSADILQGVSRVVPLELDFAPLPFGIVYRSDEDMPRPLADFIDCLRATIAALSLRELA